MRPQKGKYKIFSAAVKLFEQQGYFATTIEQITNEANVSKGLVYNYFSSKEELLAALIVDTTQRMETIALTLDSDAPLDEALDAFIDNLFRFLTTERQFLKLQLTLMLMPELQDAIGDQQKQRAKQLLKIVHTWFEQAGFPDAKDKARIFLAMVDGVALHYLHVYEEYPLESMKRHIVQATKSLYQNKELGDLR